MSSRDVIFVAGKHYEEQPQTDKCKGCAFEFENCIPHKSLRNCGDDSVIFVEKTTTLRDIINAEPDPDVVKNLCLTHNELYPADGGGCPGCAIQFEAAAAEILKGRDPADIDMEKQVTIHAGRHPSDVASDPEGLLLKAGQPLRAAVDSKPTNPKDLIATAKLPLNLVPDTVAIYAAMAFAEGASKYGAYNWRAAGVRFSIYMAALGRHQKKLWNGEWADPKTKVPHLASIIACAGIIADAKLCGKLVDDRPPAADVERLIEEAEAIVAHVVALNADKQPHHWTIADEVPA